MTFENHFNKTFNKKPSLMIKPVWNSCEKRCSMLAGVWIEWMMEGFECDVMAGGTVEFLSGGG